MQTMLNIHHSWFWLYIHNLLINSLTNRVVMVPIDSNVLHVGIRCLNRTTTSKMHVNMFVGIKSRFWLV